MVVGETAVVRVAILAKAVVYLSVTLLVVKVVLEVVVGLCDSGGGRVFGVVVT